MINNIQVKIKQEFNRVMAYKLQIKLVAYWFIDDRDYKRKARWWWPELVHLLLIAAISPIIHELQST